MTIRFRVERMCRIPGQHDDRSLALEHGSLDDHGGVGGKVAAIGLGQDDQVGKTGPCAPRLS